MNKHKQLYWSYNNMKTTNSHMFQALLAHDQGIQ